MLEIFALFASSNKTRKLQGRELPGWTIPRKFHAANYRCFTVHCMSFNNLNSTIMNLDFDYRYFEFLTPVLTLKVLNF